MKHAEERITKEDIERIYKTSRRSLRRRSLRRAPVAMLPRMENIVQMVDEVVNQCRGKGRPLPYFIIVTSANGGYVRRLTDDGAEPLLNIAPPRNVAESPIAVLIVDARGRQVAV